MSPPDINRRHTGARKLEEHPEIEEPNPVHTGDEGDEPKIPYGLTEALEDRGPTTRHHDGKQPTGHASRREMPEEQPTKVERRPL